jgi:rRNA maturation endonuclease Nob1
MGTDFSYMSLNERYERGSSMSTLSRVRAAFTTSTEDERHPYECTNCGAQFALQRQVCPECGGYSLDRTEWCSEEC